MSRHFKHTNGKYTSANELKREYDDSYAQIDSQLDDAFSKIDWSRRKQAETSLVKWVNTYCIGLLLDDSPPVRGEEVLCQMEKAVKGHDNFMILMSRGSGKSSYVECATMFAMALGIQKFTVIVSQNARSATNMMNDLWRMIQETDSAFANDYPEICFPFQSANGSFRRRQLYKGRTTDIQKNASQIVFATLKDDDGNELKTSGSMMTVRGISSGLRGMKKGTMRPSLVILDDLQDAETAENPQRVQKLLNMIRKDVMALGGKKRLSILQTATPICPDDLVEQLKNDTNWKTTTFSGIISMPKAKELWEQYFKMFDTENVQQTGHSQSLQFYKDNRAKMDEGAEVFNPNRYSEEDGHISGLQKMMEIRHVIGEAAFASEYQMQPQRYSFSLDLQPKTIVSRQTQNEPLEVPDGHIFVAASTDLNLSYALTTSIVAFKPDTSAAVIWHEITPCNIDGKLTEAEYNSRTYQVLSDLGRRLKTLGVKIDAWGIDCNGKPFSAVTQFTKNSMTICGIPSCGMIGRASHIFNPYVRTRLRNALGRTVLCGDAEERVKAGAGAKWIAWDTDFYRETAQKAFLCEIGQTGCCTLYKGKADEHTEFALQICNEKLMFVSHKQDGRNIYHWSSKDPHDYGDTMAQAYAIAASQGMSSIHVLEDNNRKHSSRFMLKRVMPKRKVVIV